MVLLTEPMGNIDKVIECLNVLDRRVKSDKGLSLNGDYFVIYNAIGNYKKVIEHSIKKEVSLFFIMINPFFEKLLEDDRYQKLLKKYFKH